MMRFATCGVALVLCYVTAVSAAEKRRAARSDAPAGKVYVYKESAGEPRQMEVYFPANHDPAKAKAVGVLMFHGGAWVGGDLSQFRVACHYLASRGLVAATANYQMLTKQAAAQLPAGETCKRVCVTDAKSAIRWFKQHAAELGVDPKRLVVGGGSAGGHIAVLATLNPGLNDPADLRDVDTSVVAYLLFNPAFSPKDAEDAQIDALRYLKPGMAPAIAFFGTKDPWKPGWNDVGAKLKSLGPSKAETWVAEGQTHSFFNRNPWQNATLIEADRFLVRLGLLQGEPTLPPPGDDVKLVKEP